MFIVSISYKVDLGKVDEFLNEHVDFLKRMYEENIFILSGRKVPRTGGIILSNVKSKEQLTEALKLDPFSRENLAEYEIIEMIPSMSSKELSCLLSEC